jgi:hypothetical protein
LILKDQIDELQNIFKLAVVELPYFVKQSLNVANITGDEENLAILLNKVIFEDSSCERK